MPHTGLQKTLKRGVETRNKKAGEKRAEKRSNIVVLKEQSLCVIDEGDQGMNSKSFANFSYVSRFCVKRIVCFKG